MAIMELQEDFQRTSSDVQYFEKLSRSFEDTKASVLSKYEQKQDLLAKVCIHQVSESP